MRSRTLAAIAALGATLVLAPAAFGAVEDSQELREDVTLETMTGHLEKLQTIADAHQGNRAAATVGYEQSVSYFADQLEDAGFEVTNSPFDFPAWEENSPPALAQVTPTPTTYVPGGPEDSDSPDVDFITFQFSGAGEVEAPVVPTDDVVIPPGATANTSTSGCESADFPAATEDAISLIQRGTCPFVQKLENAAEAGAAGVILFNEGQNEPGRQNAQFTSAPPYLPIPAVFSDFALGEELYEAFTAGENPTASLQVDATTTSRVQHNVIAESPWGGDGRTVVVGGHLDSVPEGPGINDNGTGTVAIVETARQMSALHERVGAAVADAQKKVDRMKKKVRKGKKKVKKARKKVRNAANEQAETKAKKKLKKAKKKLKKARKKRNRARRERNDAERRFDPRRPLRVALWGAEEAGLIGSSQYVEQLTPGERAEILLNLNFDMLGSPNFARQVYDGNTDETPPPEGGAPPGSDVIEGVFLDYFEAQGLPTQATAFDGRSDYGPFIAQGIPAGGLFSGAEQPKTAEEVDVFGGVEGEQLDPCYHEECDTFGSVFEFPPGLPELEGNGATSLDQMSDAVAHATFHFVTEQNPLGDAAAAERPRGKQAYELRYKGDQLTR